MYKNIGKIHEDVALYLKGFKDKHRTTLIIEGKVLCLRCANV